MNRDQPVHNEIESVHKWFEFQADNKKNEIAIKQNNQKISYRVLNQRANFLANHLESIGVSDSNVVAIEMSHSPEFIISVLAILKCGAVYLPIDKSVPAKRIELYLQTANASAIIIQGDGNDSYSYTKDLVVVSMQEKVLFNSYMEKYDSYSGTAEDPAYVMFTSGSTGKPKGVLVPHRAIVRLVMDTNYIEVRPSDSILQFAPPSFDASTFEIWGALLNGVTLVLYSGIGLDPNILKKDILENHVTIIWLTAALFHLVTDKFIDALKPLRVLLAGGDVLNPKYVNKVLKTYPEMTVINGYGPTENTTFTCCHVMTRSNLPNNNVPIGQPITGTEIHILNDLGKSVERGEVGELFTSGSGVALGYINEMGSNVGFIQNDEIATGRLYQTGDLVKQNDFGEIEFIGRKDNQVKIRGYRVSLEEIKTFIVELDNIKDAVVITQKFESGDQLLIAHVQVEECFNYNSKQIKRELASILPAYMIPDQFVFNTKLPINANGKVDRKSMLTEIALED